MYKSPIEIIRRDMQINIENAIMSAVQEVGVTVDKEELIKALAHDRDSYNRGYQDAVAALSEAIRKLDVDCVYCKHLVMEDTDYVPDICHDCIKNCNWEWRGPVSGE